MELLFYCILIGLIPAVIAQKKGRSFIGFWIYGTLLLIIALPHALLMNADPEVMERNERAVGRKKCPYCAEMIKAEAVVCRFCGRDVNSKPNETNSQPFDVSWWLNINASLPIEDKIKYCEDWLEKLREELTYIYYDTYKKDEAYKKEEIKSKIRELEHNINKLKAEQKNI